MKNKWEKVAGKDPNFKKVQTNLMGLESTYVCDL